MMEKIIIMTSDEIVTELAAMIKARCWVEDRREALELEYRFKILKEIRDRKAGVVKLDEPQIIVEVSGGVASCDDPRVTIVDHDNEAVGEPVE